MLAEVLLGLEKERVEAGAQIDIRIDCAVVQFSRKNLRSIAHCLALVQKQHQVCKPKMRVEPYTTRTYIQRKPK